MRVGLWPSLDECEMNVCETMYVCMYVCVYVRVYACVCVFISARTCSRFFHFSLLDWQSESLSEGSDAWSVSQSVQNLQRFHHSPK